MVLLASQATSYIFDLLEKVRREITCWNIGEPSSKAKYYKFSDSEKYCEGKFWKASSILGETDRELVTL